MGGRKEIDLGEGGQNEEQCGRNEDVTGSRVDQAKEWGGIRDDSVYQIQLPS